MKQTYPMIQTMRWYGPDDPVSLLEIKQAGATGVISALHQLPNGVVWTKDEILKRKALIEAVGLEWTGVESLPVHEHIKTHTGDYPVYIENYKTSIRNLASCGIRLITYNFMPLIDWTRTSLYEPMKDGSLAMAYDPELFAVFDLCILKRRDAEKDYSDNEIDAAQKRFLTLDQKSRETLTTNILTGLPGAEEKYTPEILRKELQRYAGYTAEILRSNLIEFLQEVIPVCDEVGAVMAIHPDDPPRNIMGLPRIMSCADDFQQLIDAVPSHANGLCLCTGSMGSNLKNNMVDMIYRFAPYLQFLHLRSTKQTANGGFYEANLLEGSLDMYAIVRAVIEVSEQEQRRIVMRPDHGHLMLGERNRKGNPGYSYIGRLRSLAELRGLEVGIMQTLKV
jgi:mannonate dehydratase